MKVKQFQVLSDYIYVLTEDGTLWWGRKDDEAWFKVSAPPDLAVSPRTKRTGKRAISDEDKPTDKHFDLGEALGLNVGAEWAKFKNYCLANNKRYADFEAAFRNWLTNEQFRKPKGGV